MRAGRTAKAGLQTRLRQGPLSPGFTDQLAQLPTALDDDRGNVVGK